MVGPSVTMTTTPTAPATAAAVTMSVHVGLSPHVIPILSVDEQREDGGDEEEDAIHDAKGEARFENGACLVDIERPGATPTMTPASKRPQVQI